MLTWGRSRSYLAATAVAVTLGACGSNTTTTTPKLCPDGTTGTPPNCTAVNPCTQTVVQSGNGPAKSKVLYFFDFSVPDTGRLDVTLDWTNASSLLGVYLVPANTCSLDEFNARSCNFLLRSEPPSAKPRKVSVPNLPAGNYRWLIANFSDNDESVSYQFVLSKGSCAAFAAGGQPAISSRGGETVRAMERAKAY